MGSAPSTELDKKSTAEEAATKCLEESKEENLKDRVFVVTGANTGIGRETAQVLAAHGGTVILACRSDERGKETESAIKTETKNDNVEYMKLDLNSLQSVRDFADAFLKKDMPLHVLINNAGVMAIPEFEKTEDGFEKQWGINHLGHFLLTNLLLDKIKASAPSRIVNVSSRAHRKGGHISLDNLPPKADQYKSWGNYGISKISNVMFAAAMNRRLKDTNVTSVSLHPGVIPTDLSRYNWFGGALKHVAFMFPKSIAQGAATTIYCALSPEVPKHGGEYYADCHIEGKIDKADDQEFQEELWKLSERLTGLAPQEEEQKAAEPVTDEPADDKPGDEPAADDPGATKPKAEEPKAEQSEEPKVEENKAEEPKAEEPKAEEPKAEEPKAEEPKAEEPKAEDPPAEEPKEEEPKAEAQSADSEAPAAGSGAADEKPEEPAGNDS